MRAGITVKERHLYIDAGIPCIPPRFLEESRFNREATCLSSTLEIEKLGTLLEGKVVGVGGVGDFMEVK